MPPINIVWIGFHEEGLPAFRAVLDAGQRIARFVTLTDASFGKRSAGSRGYLELCEIHGVPVSMVKTIKDDAAYEIVAAEPFDLLVVLGWSEILPARLLRLPSIGTVGAHASLLPHNRGSAPVNWALIRGETQGGNTLMWLNEQVDEGRIIDQIPFDITLYDTCATLYGKVAQTNQTMMTRLLRRLERGEIPSLPIENRTDEPLLPRRRPADGALRWDRSAKEVYDFIRALTRPYPGAFSSLDGKRFTVWTASLLPGGARLGEPGEILGAVRSPEAACCGVAVACETGAVALHELEDEEGRVLTGQALSEAGLAGRFAASV